MDFSIEQYRTQRHWIRKSGRCYPSADARGGAWRQNKHRTTARSLIEAGLRRHSLVDRIFGTALSHSVSFERKRGQRRSHPAAIASAQYQRQPSFHGELLVHIVKVNFHCPFGDVESS